MRPADATLLADYLHGKQTCRQLAAKHHCSSRTIRRRLARLPLPSSRATALPGSAVALLDTSYFGREFGVLVLKDAATGTNLLAGFVDCEKNAFYKEALNVLETHGCRVLAAVCDGRKGLPETLGARPVQLCQFHQIATVRRLLTRKPKLPAARQLWRLTRLLPRLKEAAFTSALAHWHARWVAFLNERSASSGTRRSRYSHPRLRSAFLSLNRNLPRLFICLRFPRLEIPNTTNLIDGSFSELKNKLRNHNGLSKEQKKKLILHLLSPAIIHCFVH